MAAAPLPLGGAGMDEQHDAVDLARPEGGVRHCQHRRWRRPARSRPTRGARQAFAQPLGAQKATGLPSYKGRPSAPADRRRRHFAAAGTPPPWSHVESPLLIRATEKLMLLGAAQIAVHQMTRSPACVMTTARLATASSCPGVDRRPPAAACWPACPGGKTPELGAQTLISLGGRALGIGQGDEIGTCHSLDLASFHDPNRTELRCAVGTGRCPAGGQACAVSARSVKTGDQCILARWQCHRQVKGHQIVHRCVLRASLQPGSGPNASVTWPVYLGYLVARRIYHVYKARRRLAGAAPVRIHCKRSGTDLPACAVGGALNSDKTMASPNWASIGCAGLCCIGVRDGRLLLPLPIRRPYKAPRAQQRAVFQHRRAARTPVTRRRPPPVQPSSPAYTPTPNVNWSASKLQGSVCTTCAALAATST